MNSLSIVNVVRGLLLCVVCGAAPGLLAQPAGNFTVNPDWAQVSGGVWDGSTSWITADGKGKVIVLVRTAPYFREFTRDGAPVRSFGAAGQFDTAHSVSVDPAGNLWVTDSSWHVVRKFSADGELLMTLGRQGVAGDNTSIDSFNQPNHVAFAPDGAIYVSDGYVNARVVQFDKDGTFVRIIGGVQGSEPGQLQVPHGVAIDSTGRILVNDSDNARVSVFDPDGNFVESWPFPSRGGLVVLPDDTVYVSDVNAGIVNILDRNGTLLDSVAVDRAHGLGVDSDGSIYVSGASRMTVYKVTRQ